MFFSLLTGINIADWGGHLCLISNYEFMLFNFAGNKDSSLWRSSKSWGSKYTPLIPFVHPPQIMLRPHLYSLNFQQWYPFLESILTLNNDDIYFILLHQILFHRPIFVTWTLFPYYIMMHKKMIISIIFIIYYFHQIQQITLVYLLRFWQR